MDAMYVCICTHIQVWMYIGMLGTCMYSARMYMHNGPTSSTSTGSMLTSEADRTALDSVKKLL